MADRGVIMKITNWATDTMKKLPDIGKQMDENRKKVIEEENAAWDAELGKAQEEAYKEAFYSVIDKFYYNYEPSRYGRHFALYRAWETHFDDDGLIAGTTASGTDGWYIDFQNFISRNLYGELTTPMREGGSDTASYLFEQAFSEGWHGGAKTINDPTYGGEPAETWGYHPSPGTPYYRKPGWVTYSDGERKRHQYAKWGRRAKKMSTPPKTLLEKKIQSITKNELAAVDAKLFKEHQEKVTERVIAFETELLTPLLQPDWINDF